MIGEQVTFWIVSPIAVLSAIGLVLARKAVHAALFVAVTMICLAVLYIVQEAPFLGVVQIVVYTGAIMMLFLFVIMLVGVDASESRVETIRGQRVAAVLVGAGVGTLLITVVVRATLPAPVGLTDATPEGNVPGIADLIFTRYVWAFEVTSALLITAALGAMVLAHRERLSPRQTQRELADLRFRGGALAYSGPRPNPGVYARHNAVDTPALLPDGSPSQASISKVMTARGTVYDVGAAGAVDALRTQVAEATEGSTPLSRPETAPTGEAPAHDPVTFAPGQGPRP